MSVFIKLYRMIDQLSIELTFSATIRIFLISIQFKSEYMYIHVSLFTRI